MSTKVEHTSKLNVTGDIGEKIDASKDAAEKEVQQLIGAQRALNDYYKLALPILTSVTDDMNDSKSAFPKEGASSLEVSEYVKRKITQVLNGLVSAADKMQMDSHIARGKAKAFADTLDLVNKFHIASKVRLLQMQEAELEAIQNAEEEKLKTSSEEQEAVRPRGRARNPGQHPGPSAGAIRRAGNTETAEPAEDPNLSDVEAVAEEPKITPIVRRRGRPRKSETTNGTSKS